MAHTSYQERLEAVRKHFKIPSLQEFVDRLNEDSEDPVPYATARRYHNTDRKPPAEYLVRVWNAFPGTRLDYLLGGEGPITNQEARARAVAAALKRFQGAPHPMATITAALEWEPITIVNSAVPPQMTKPLMTLAQEFLGEVVTSRGEILPEPQFTATEATLLIRSLRHVLGGPWKAFRSHTAAGGVEDGSTDEGWADYLTYAVAALQALRLALPAPEELGPRELAARLVRLWLGAVEPTHRVSAELLPKDVPEDERDMVLEWLNMGHLPQHADAPGESAPPEPTNTEEEPHA